MKFGVNITSLESYDMAMELFSAGEIEYAELLLDNFIGMEPEEVGRRFKGVPVAFHVMQSRFMEADEQRWTWFVKRLKAYIEVLNPLYVSDHICYFNYFGRRLPMPMEYDYLSFEHCRDAACRYQDAIGRKMYFENYASCGPEGRGQAEFFAELTERADCGILFDVSNAEIAENNGGDPFSAWEPLESQIRHAHCGGFRKLNEDGVLLVDSHDNAVSAATASRARRFTSLATMTVERDADFSLTQWRADIGRVRDA